MKLKIAFCFCTEIRDGYLMSESIKAFMQSNDDWELDIDYYLHTWDHTYLKDHNKWEDSIKNGNLKEGEFKRRRVQTKTQIDFEKLNKFINAYDIKKHRIDNEREHLFPLRKQGFCHFDLDYLWESLRLAFELIDEPKNYDIVIYSRPDICFAPKFKFVDYIGNHLSEITNTFIHNEMFLFLSTPYNIKTILDRIIKMNDKIINTEINDYRGAKVFKKMGFDEKQFAPSMFPAIVRPENLHLNPVTDFEEFYRINKILYS